MQSLGTNVVVQNRRFKILELLNKEEKLTRQEIIETLGYTTNQEKNLLSHDLKHLSSRNLIWITGVEDTVNYHLNIRNSRPLFQQFSKQSGEDFKEKQKIQKNPLKNLENMNLKQFLEKLPSPLLKKIAEDLEAKKKSNLERTDLIRQILDL